MKELEEKFHVDHIKKKWRELLKKFKQEHAKASHKPSGAGTSDIYKPSWEFYDQLMFVTVICDDTDDTVSSIIVEPKKPKMRRMSQREQRDIREDKKLQLFSDAVEAIRHPPTQNEKSSSIEQSEVAAFANYVRLSLSKLNSQKFRRAKKCIGDILFQLEENNELESASVPPARLNPSGRYSPSPSMTSYKSNESSSSYHQGAPTHLDNLQMPPYSSNDFYIH